MNQPKQPKIQVDINKVINEYKNKIGELDRQLVFSSVYIQQLEARIEELESKVEDKKDKE